MNLPELAYLRLYAPLFAALDMALSSDPPRGRAQPPAEAEPMRDDFEETRPIWFVSGSDEEPAAECGGAAV